MKYRYFNILLFIKILFSQEFPQELIEYQFEKLKFDLGENWENNSTLDPISYKNHNKLNDTSKINISYGFLTKISKKEPTGNSLFFYGKSIINDNLYMYFYPRIVTNPNAFKRYSGIPRPKKRFGFNSGETDLAGIVFSFDNFETQIARGRQIWGAGNGLDILISENSHAYDYLMFKFFYKNIEFRAFNGFLEKVENYNRYISARAVQWSNKSNILLSVSEVIIYSGINRPFDFSYFNPISSHLEIELNKGRIN